MGGEKRSSYLLGWDKWDLPAEITSPGVNASSCTAWHKAGVALSALNATGSVEANWKSRPLAAASV